MGQIPEMYFPYLDRLARFMAGILGGAWLIVPLLVMVFDASLSRTMITVSDSVVLFALAVSLVFETDNKDTLTATATLRRCLWLLLEQAQMHHRRQASIWRSSSVSLVYPRGKHQVCVDWWQQP
jgi:hypothetical protein